MTRKAPRPRQTIVVSDNRPKIAISKNRHDLEVGVVIPAGSRRSLVLAHVIVASTLGDLTDAMFDRCSAPVIRSGQHSTCYVITFGLRPIQPGSEALLRAKLTLLAKAVAAATRRAVAPRKRGGEPTHDVIEVA